MKINFIARHLAYIDSFDEAKQIGRITVLGSGISKERNYTFFKLTDCRTCIWNYKIVVCDLYKNQQIVEIKNIQDFDLRTHEALSQLLIDFKSNTNGMFLFENNPNLTSLFIEHNLIHLYYQEIIKKIKKLYWHIENINQFSIEEAIGDYKIKIEEIRIRRPGRDDSAFINKVARQVHWIGDPYIDTLLPTYSKTLAHDKYFSSAEVILRELWSELGGDSKKAEFERECLQEQIATQESAKNKYNFDTHFDFLIQFRNEIERDLYKKIDINHSKIKKHY